MALPDAPRSHGRVRGVLLDVGPLRHDRDYRLIWGGQVVSSVGTNITRVALPFQVYVLTGSTLAVAALTTVQLIAILAFSIGAGSLADAFDRRRLLIVTQVGLALSSAALAAVAMLPTPSLGLILGLAFVHASVGAIDQPTRASAIPRLVPPERLSAAIALNQLNFQVASIAGPAIGGLLIATIGLAAAYAVDAASFTASIVALLAIRPLRPLAGAARPGLQAIREGFVFVRSQRVILSTFAIDLNAMIFGMPASLFPILALDVFDAGPTGFGLLAAAPAAGAFVGALTSGWITRVVRIGGTVIVMVAAWGAAITGFGIACILAADAPGVMFIVALVMLALAGAADVLSAVLRGTITQLSTPDNLRGRVTSIHLLVVTSGPRIGDIEAAAVASVVGPQLSVLSGGLLCLLGVVVVARWFPELAAHRRSLRPRDG
ncbi:MAG: MFS transporter [Chloroflexota bacterium]|mgnify:FL=1